MIIWYQPYRPDRFPCLWIPRSEGGSYLSKRMDRMASSQLQRQLEPLRSWNRLSQSAADIGILYAPHLLLSEWNHITYSAFF